MALESEGKYASKAEVMFVPPDKVSFVVALNDRSDFGGKDRLSTMTLRSLPDNERNMSEISLVYKPSGIIREESAIHNRMESVIMASTVESY